ncbi:MAG: Ig-like domain-containing domain [Chitinophagales bacterium]|nr:Ig-like domain-containing domain [Chitinophagales bacterium]
MRLNYLLFFFVILIYSCANQVAPTGGPKDATPPKAISAEPQDKNTNFKGNKVIINFDEYIKVDNVLQNVIVSPPLKTFPEIESKGKSLQITFKEPLKDNTTYTINFGDAIKDITEDNVQRAITYVFSTGPFIDSFSIQGIALSANKSEVVEGALVLLYDDLSDTAIIKSKPYYYSVSDKSGRFKIENIKEGRYQLFALKDANFNLQYDLPNEEIAFLDSFVKIDSSKSPSYQLNLFQEQSSQPKLLDTYVKSKDRITFTYSQAIDSIGITPLDSTTFTNSQLEYNLTRDTITLWYNRHTANPRFVLTANDSIRDTVTISRKPFPLDSNAYTKLSIISSFSSKRGDQIQNLYEPVECEFNHPIDSVDTNRIIVYEDTLGTTPVTADIQMAELSNRKLLVSNKWKEDTWYTFSLGAGAFTDIYGRQNDSTKLIFKTPTADDYGTLVLSINGLQKNEQYIISLFLPNSVPVYSNTLKGLDSTTITIPHLEAKGYQLKIIKDRNANGKWDSGNYPQRRQPEKIYMHPNLIEIKPNWEIKAAVDLK